MNGQAFNIAADVSFSVLDLIHTTEKILKKKISFRIDNLAVNEIPYQHLNDEKIRSYGWKHTYSIEESLRQTYAWYRKIV